MLEVFLSKLSTLSSYWKKQRNMRCDCKKCDLNKDGSCTYKFPYINEEGFCEHAYVISEVKRLRQKTATDYISDGVIPFPNTYQRIA